MTAADATDTTSNAIPSNAGPAAAMERAARGAALTRSVQLLNVQLAAATKQRKRTLLLPVDDAVRIRRGLHDLAEQVKLQREAGAPMATALHVALDALRRIAAEATDEETQRIAREALATPITTSESGPEVAGDTRGAVQLVGADAIPAEIRAEAEAAAADGKAVFVVDATRAEELRSGPWPAAADDATGAP